MPVVVWVSTFAAGGTERQMTRLIAGLDPAVYEVHAACFLAAGPWRDLAAQHASSVVEFPLNGFRTRESRRSILAFARWCRERQIGAVITSDFYTNVFGLSGAALARVPVRIGGRREINTDKNLAKLLLQRTAYAAAHRVVANSRAAADRLLAERVPARRIAIVPNGLDVPAAPPRAARPISRVITVANLRAEKGHDVLIEAIASSPDLRRLTFDFVGDGPCRPALEARARERGVADCIRFLGHREDVAALLSASDLFVLPSRTEAFPNSLMEAMAAGLPCVASAAGGMLELIDEGKTGRLVPVGDARSLAAAIREMTASPDRAVSIGAAARDVVRARYSTATMVAGFSRIIQEELARRSLRTTADPVSVPLPRG